MPTRIKLFGDTQRADEYRFIALRKHLADALMLRSFQNLAIYRHAVRLPEGGSIDIVCHHNMNEIAIHVPPREEREEERERERPGLILFFVGNETVGYHYIVVDEAGQSLVQDIKRASKLENIEKDWPPTDNRDCYLLMEYVGQNASDTGYDNSICGSDADTPAEWGATYPDYNWLPDHKKAGYEFEVMKDGYVCFQNDTISGTKSYIDHDFDFAKGANTNQNLQMYQFYTPDYDYSANDYVSYPVSQKLKLITPGLEGELAPFQNAIRYYYMYSELVLKAEIFSQYFFLPFMDIFPRLWGGTDTDDWPDKGWGTDVKLTLEAVDNVVESEMHSASDYVYTFEPQPTEDPVWPQNFQFREWMRRRYKADYYTTYNNANFPYHGVDFIFNRCFDTSYSGELGRCFQVFLLQVPEWNGNKYWSDSDSSIEDDVVMPRDTNYTNIDGHIVMIDPECIDDDGDGSLDAPYNYWRFPIKDGTVYDTDGSELSMPWQLADDPFGHGNYWNLEYGHPSRSDNAPVIVKRDKTDDSVQEVMEAMYEEIRDRFWIAASTGGGPDPRAHTRNAALESNLRKLVQTALSDQRTDGYVEDYEAIRGELHGYFISPNRTKDYKYIVLRELLRLVNEERESQGVGKLMLNWDLNKAATRHAWDSARNGLSGHTGSDGSSTEARIVESGFHFGGHMSSPSYDYSVSVQFGENAGQQYPLDAQAIFDAWKGSSEHYPVMIDSTYTETGVDFFYGQDNLYYWVQTFGYNPNH